MLILFVIIYILASHSVYSIATDKNTGYNPYPCGTAFFSILLHVIVLVMCIYYMGWGFGILLFLCHFFSLVHATVSWVFNIPGLILLAKNDYNKLYKQMELNLALFTPIFFITLIFTVVSFFVTDFRSMLVFLQNNNSVLLVSGIIVAILSIARIIVAKKIIKKQ